jgi:hypothetical protein
VVKVFIVKRGQVHHNADAGAEDNNNGADQRKNTELPVLLFQQGRSLPNFRSIFSSFSTEIACAQYDMPRVIFQVEFTGEQKTGERRQSFLVVIDRSV